MLALYLTKFLKLPRSFLGAISARGRLLECLMPLILAETLSESLGLLDRRFIFVLKSI